jgi:1-acyl-sn-glycerol-3-phosphate acyltransferase
MMMKQEVLYRLGLPVVDLYAGMMFGMDVAHHAALPAGPKIIAPNHPTTTDPFLITTLTSEPIGILIDDRLFKVPVFGRYLHATGHIPVVPGNGRVAFDEALRRLKAGQTVAIFPEGAISPLAGGFHPPRTGAARLAILSGAPVVPVGINLDRGRIRLTETIIEGKVAVGTWYFMGPYAMTVGEPMWFAGSVEDRGRVAAASQAIMQRIMRLAHESAVRMSSMQVFDTGVFPRPVGISNAG